MAPLPENQTVLIQLDYLKAKNVASRGIVVFTPPRTTIASEEAIMTAAPCEVTVEAGEAEVHLIPTDAGTYQITEILDGVPDMVWHINVPTALAGQTRSLFSFAPVQPIVQGVAVNTMLSGSGAPSALTGIDGDYYYDVPGKVWYGPKALGAWPAGFSVVGPAGTNGTNGTNGDEGPAGPPGTRISVVQEHITSGNVALPDSLGQWRKPGDMSGPTPTGLPADFVLEVPAAVGDWVECVVQAMRTETTSAFLDVAVQKGSALVKYLATDSATPPFEGDPGWYAGSYLHQTGPRGFYATAAEIDGAVVRFVMANLSTGQGTMYASPEYHFIWSARNLGPAPA